MSYVSSGLYIVWYTTVNKLQISRTEWKGDIYQYIFHQYIWSIQNLLYSGSLTTKELSVLTGDSNTIGGIFFRSEVLTSLAILFSTRWFAWAILKVSGCSNIENPKFRKYTAFDNYLPNSRIAFITRFIDILKI